MQRTIRTALAATILVCGTGAAHGLTVTDPGNTAKNAAVLGEVKKQLTELKKVKDTVNEVRDTMNDVRDTVGPAVSAVMNPTRSLQRTISSATCLIPDLSYLNMPDDYAPAFFNVCEAKKNAEEVLFGDPEGEETFDGEPVPERERHTMLVERRASILRDAVIEGYGVAMTHQQNASDGADFAADLLDATGNATDLMGLLREQNRALSEVLNELATQRQILTALLKIQAVKTSREVPQIEIKRIADQ